VIMKIESRIPQSSLATNNWRSDASLHESWQALIRFCEQLQHGEIEKIKIQDGVPVLAEIATKKIKFI
jgi:hypothetical protein